MAGSVIGALRVNLGLDSAQFIKGTQNASNAMKGMSAKIAVAGAAITAAIGGAAYEFMKLARESINTADEISKSAVKIGIATEELSRLRYAADLSGVSFESLEKGLLILNRNMAGVGGESAKVSQAFASMGVSTRNADGSLKSSTEVLKAISDAFAKLPDGAQKSALAMAVFGKSGADLIPLLNGGSVALQQLMDEASKFGIVIDTETGRAAEQFNDNLTRLRGVFTALATQVAAKMLPVLVEFTNFLVQNQGAIAAVVQVASQLATGLFRLGQMVFQAADAFRNSLSPSVSNAMDRLWQLTQRALALTSPLGQVVSLLLKLGRSGASKSWEELNAMSRAGQWLDAATQLEAYGMAAQSAAGALGTMSGAASGASGSFRALKNDTDDSARALQSLMDRLFPAQAEARKLAEDLALINGSKLDDATKGKARVQLLTGGRKAEVKVVDPGPIGVEIDNAKQLIGDFAKDTEIKTVRIADSFAQMTQRITSSLQGLANSIRSGDFLGILGGVLDVFTQLGSAGVFGKKLQTNLTKPYGGARAMGGPVSLGKQYLVGERGPEVFVPGSPGRIVPNHALGGGGAHITVGVDPRTGNLTAFVDGRIGATAPIVANAGALQAQAMTARSTRRRVR